MNSKLFCKVLNQFNSIYRFLPKCCIQWNSTKSQFSYDFNHRHLKWWYCSLILMISFLGCCIVLLLGAILSWSFSMPEATLIVMGFIAAYSLLAICMAFMLIVYGSDFVACVNNLMAFETKLASKSQKPSVPSKYTVLIAPENSTNKDQGTAPTWRTFFSKLLNKLLSETPEDLHEVFVLWASKSYALGALPFAVFGVYSDMDPFPYIFNFSENIVLFYVLRLLLGSLVCVEIFRLLHFINVIITGVPRLINNCIFKIKERLNKFFPKDTVHQGYGDKAFVILIKLHIRLYIIVSIWRNFSRWLVSTLLIVSFTVEVIVSVITLRMYGVIPMPFYCAFPITLVLIFLTILECFNQVCTTNEESGEIIRSLERESHRCNILLRKRIKSLQKIEWQAGISGYILFFPMTRSSKRTFYWSVIYYITAAILSSSGSALSVPTRF